MPVRGGSVVVGVRGEGPTVSSRVQQSQPIQGKTVAQAGLSGAATGTLLSYTCPAGTQAEVTFIGCGNVAGGAPTIGLRVFVGSQNVVLSTGTGQQSISGPFYLNATDIVRIDVLTAVVGSTFDACICVREYSAI